MAVAASVLVTVILVRIAWHMPFNAVVRWRHRRFGFTPPPPMLRPTVGSGMVIACSGMRGIVTLAAAIGLHVEFPYRGLIVLTTFAVVLGTLVIQGLTLKPLLRALKLDDSNPFGRELSSARASAMRAALDSFAQDHSPVAETVRQGFTARLERHQTETEDDTKRSAQSEIYRRALEAARQAALGMRANDEIGDDAYNHIEEELDRIAMAGRGEHSN